MESVGKSEMPKTDADIRDELETTKTLLEKALIQLADRDMELSIVKKELQQYNLREMANHANARAASMEYHRIEFLKKNPGYVPPPIDASKLREEDEID